MSSQIQHIYVAEKEIPVFHALNNIIKCVFIIIIKRNNNVTFDKFIVINITVVFNAQD